MNRTRTGAAIAAAVTALGILAAHGTDHHPIVARPLFQVAHPALGKFGSNGYTPNQVRHAYGFDTIAATGSGQIIAIIDAYGSPTLASDVQTFSTRYSLPFTSSTLTIAYPSGMPATSDAGWGYETTMDVEWAHAIAPDAKILVCIAPTANFSDLIAAVDYANTYKDPVTGQTVHQISMSWGATEYPFEVSQDAHFSNPGISYFAAAGDGGAGVQYPASSPYVVGVGGTTLTLNILGQVSGETGWAQSGGGPSTQEAEPSFQAAVQTSGKRETPDVSYDADPNTGFAVYNSTPYNGLVGWSIGGGTSAGTPQWAALAAIVNSQRATPLSYLGASIYAAPSASFRDITSGTNGTYSCGPGYDEVTGLGSPLAGSLVPDLTAASNPPPPPPPPSPPPGSPPPPPPPPVALPPPPSVPSGFTGGSGGGGGGGGCRLGRGGSGESLLPLLAVGLLVVVRRRGL